MTERKSTMRFVLLIVWLWALLYGSFALVRPPLLDDADSVHAEVAREMVARHDWITLYANGIRYLEKAPLMYWSMAASFKLFGVADWSARLPLAIYTLALFLATFSLARRMFASNVAGFYSAIVLLTSFGIFIFTRTLIPDVMVCLWMTVAMLCFWRSLEKPSRLSAFGFAAACALNVLTKGLIGIVFPVAVVLIFLLITRNLRHLPRWHPLLGGVAFLMIAAPWHLAAGFANPTQGHPIGLNPTQGNVRGWFWFYFVNEHVLRYVDQRVPRDYDTVPLLLFWSLLAIFLVPWIAFAFAPLARFPLVSALLRRPLDAAGKRIVFLVIWATAVMVFFSFSTRQEYYVLPAMPAIALIIGGWLAANELEARSKSGILIAKILFVLGFVGAVAAGFFAIVGKTPAPNADLAAMLQQHPQDYALSFGHFLDLNAAAMGAFRTPLILTALALIAGTSANLRFRLRGRVRLANLSIATMMVTFLVAAHLALVIFSPVLSSYELAQAIAKQIRADDMVVINGEYESGSTLSFYLQRQVHILNGRSSNLWYGSFFPDAPAIFEDSDSIAAKWNGSQRIFVWTEPGNLPPIPGIVFSVASSGGKEIVSNRP